MDESKVTALHQRILDALSRKGIAIGDRYWREKCAIKRALKILDQLNSCRNGVSMDAERYQEKFQILSERSMNHTYQ